MISRAIRMISRKTLITLADRDALRHHPLGRSVDFPGSGRRRCAESEFRPARIPTVFTSEPAREPFSCLTMADTTGRAWRIWAATTMFSITSPSILRIPNTFMFPPGASRTSRLAMCIARTMAATTGKRFPACTANQCGPWRSSASDSKVLVVGALDGVFRTKNGGNSWERISPASQAEIKEHRVDRG